MTRQVDLGIEPTNLRICKNKEYRKLVSVESLKSAKLLIAEGYTRHPMSIYVASRPKSAELKSGTAYGDFTFTPSGKRKSLSLEKFVKTIKKDKQCKNTEQYRNCAIFKEFRQNVPGMNKLYTDDTASANAGTYVLWDHRHDRMNKHGWHGAPHTRMVTYLMNNDGGDLARRRAISLYTGRLE